MKYRIIILFFLYGISSCSPRDTETTPSRRTIAEASAGNQSLTAQNSFFDMVDLWTILACVLFTGIALFLWKLNSEISYANKKISEMEHKIRFLNKTQVADNQGTNNVRELRREVDELKRIIRELERSASVSKVEPAVSEGPVEVILEVPKKELDNVVFYMPTPIDEKVFDIRGKSDVFQPTRTLYKFLVHKSGNRAEFEFHSDDMGVRDAVNYPQRYITPVCEPQNSLNQNSKKIITVQKGTAENQGDKWIVTQKAKIRYE